VKITPTKLAKRWCHLSSHNIRQAAARRGRGGSERTGAGSRIDSHGTILLPRLLAPVIIEFGRRGGTHHVIRTVHHASQCLVVGWPEEGRGPRYTVACNACIATLADEIVAEKARQAFITAAKEVDIFVREGGEAGFPRGHRP
jgi:hypothetical protein